MGPTTRSALGKIYLLSSSILFGEKGCGMYQGRVGSQAKKLCGSGLCGIPSAFRGEKKDGQGCQSGDQHLQEGQATRAGHGEGSHNAAKRRHAQHNHIQCPTGGSEADTINYRLLVCPDQDLARQREGPSGGAATTTSWQGNMPLELGVVLTYTTNGTYHRIGYI